MHQGSCLCGSIKYSIDDNLKLMMSYLNFARRQAGASLGNYVPAEI